MATIILGGTGTVGKGIAYHQLSRGETVVVVTRDLAKENKFRLEMQEIRTPNLEKLYVVEGDFLSDGEAHKVYQAVVKYRPKHVISILGSVEIIEGPPSEATPEKLRGVLEIFTATVRSINAFVPKMKHERGTTFTVQSGGFGHGVTDLHLWSATLKNGLLNHYHKLLAAELKDAPLRYNTACLHYSVSFPSPHKKIILKPDNNTLDYGAVFPALLADDSMRSQLVCFTDPESTKAWISGRQRVEQ